MSELIRKNEVLKKLNIGKTKLRELIRAGEFPPPLKLKGYDGKDGRTCFWSLSAVDAWIDDRAARAIAEAVRGRRNDPFGRSSF